MRALASKAARASGIADPDARRKFRDEFLDRLRTDPTFLEGMLKEAAIRDHVQDNPIH